MCPLTCSDVTALVPLLIDLLNPLPQANREARVEFDSSVFVPATEALEEVMSKSVLSDGSGSKTLTEPLLVWCERWGGTIIEITSEGTCQVTLRLH
jgi:hypothetical protein